MPDTLHRRDIGAADFRILAKFCSALDTLQQGDEELLWYLGEVKMYLPVWFRSAGVWGLSRYKEFTQEAVGISTIDFRRICRFIDVKEPVVINVLYRMSILAVAGWQSVLDRPKYRQEFHGVPFRDLGDELMSSFGYILEMRRCDGAFRGFRNDSFWYSDDSYHLSEEQITTDMDIVS
jgi:hypothetical protein